MFKLVVSLLFVLFVFIISAQEVDKVIDKNGKKYISHYVVKGETIFRICKSYSITSEELNELNPSINKGLQLGKTILIPIKEKTGLLNDSIIKFNIFDQTTITKVATLFNLKVADLKALNPTCSVVLLPGTQLNVPADSLLLKSVLYRLNAKVKPDTIIQYVVDQKDLMYSIAKRFMTSVNEIQALNLKSNTLISVNSILLIPITDRRVLETNHGKSINNLNIEKEKLIVSDDSLRIKESEVKLSIVKVEIQKNQLQFKNETQEPLINGISEKLIVPVENTDKKTSPVEQLKKERSSKVINDKMNQQKNLLELDSSNSIKLAKGILQKEVLKENQISKEMNTSFLSQNSDTNKIIQDSTQSRQKFVLTFLLPFNSEKKNDPTSKVATEFYMGVQLALDSLSKLKFKGTVNVFDCGNDTSKLNLLFLKEELIASNLIIGPLNGINLIQTADFCKRNLIPMVNPIMSNTSLLKNNKFVYNAVSSEMSLVKGLAKYVYRKHSKDQVVLVKVGGKDEELYEEFRSAFSKQGANKLYEVNESNILSVIKKDKKSIFVILTRDKELATKISKRLSEHIDRNRFTRSLTLYGTKDWLNFETISEEIKKKVDFKYNSSIDFNSSNVNLTQLRNKFKEKFKISLTKYAAQGFDVTFYFVNRLLLNANDVTAVMNVFDLNRIEKQSGFENGGSYVFGYEDEDLKRIQVLHD